MAPGAAIVVIEAAPGNTDSQVLTSLMAAVQTANTTPGVTVVSMSWGLSEFSNEASYDSNFTTPGITYIASSGDSGSCRVAGRLAECPRGRRDVALSEQLGSLSVRERLDRRRRRPCLGTSPSRAIKLSPVHGLPEHARRLVRWRPEYRSFRLRHLAEQHLGPGTVGGLRRHERRRPVLGWDHRHHRSGPRARRPGESEHARRPCRHSIQLPRPPSTKSPRQPLRADCGGFGGGGLAAATRRSIHPPIIHRPAWVRPTASH